ncbi:E3 ubiquitin-protein ligase TRIM39-like [Amblyraja radiata]|uniref:E3 ubiquitin-protein ligase TRIM39-like n=1 Tax=Amblyraja radiata TaxID=386614 RepID=UPI001403A35F|nr:E3 ubiquitin-protein ligase TRIM39-like [Amblyraja radiata]
MPGSDEAMRSVTRRATVVSTCGTSTEANSEQHRLIHERTLICVICATGREHKSHSFMPVKEAVETYKDQVKSSIQSLTKKESEIQQMEQQQIQKISAVLEQSHNFQSQITSQYAELHQILTEKEQRALANIREEEKKILNTMEKNLGEIQENLNSIENEVKRLQELLDLKDVSFLKEEAGRKMRICDEAKSLSVVDGALPIEGFDNPFMLNVLRETTDIIKQVSVALDVETAHPDLEVSEDQKRVRLTRTHRSLPDTGKKFTVSRCLVGTEGFTSGRYYWEVEVVGSRFWSLGVAAESVERKRRVILTPDTGVWSIRGWGGGFDALTSPRSRLPARPIPGRVGVYLSYESGTVSFYDADIKSHLHTFTGNKFMTKRYPFFGPWD